MQTPRSREKGLILILAASVMLAGCTPEKYSGGTGGRYDPYQIATVDDLLAMAAQTNDYGAHFVLTADIDLNPNLPGRVVFTSSIIARDINNSGGDFDGVAFNGVFDGAGHKIANLTINTYGSGNDYLGLFGYIAGGKVKNLVLENVHIRGGAGSFYIGGLTGCSNRGKITKCTSTGTVASGKNSDSIGGLVGDNFYGSIIDSASMCDVLSGSYSSNLGGLVGGNIGIINKCRSAGAVTGGNTSMWLGGLAGSNSGAIRDCSSTGTVTGGAYSYNIGGLVGDSYNGIIINCHSTTIVEAIIPDVRCLIVARK
jgi:hypothetical protein